MIKGHFRGFDSLKHLNFLSFFSFIEFSEQEVGLIASMRTSSSGGVSTFIHVRQLSNVVFNIIRISWLLNRDYILSFSLLVDSLNTLSWRFLIILRRLNIFILKYCKWLLTSRSHYIWLLLVLILLIQQDNYLSF
mgnify:CR=1 FL=1